MQRIKPQFTAVFQKTRQWYMGWVEEIPGVNTQGKTLKEAKENLKEALDMILEANRKITHLANGAHQTIRTPISPTL